MTATESPRIATVATSALEDDAAKLSSSPSGSLKWSWRVSWTVFPTWTSVSGIESETSGARFGTVTVKLCSAGRPPGSVAVTVTVAVPWPTAATVREAPEAEAVATPSSEEVAA